MTTSNREVRELGIDDLDHVAGGMLSLGVIRAYFCAQASSVFLGPVIGTSIGSGIGAGAAGGGGDSA
ncbi:MULTISPECIES: hypothetical protein [unclassified Bradyrhizobium]|uniref:hypothetical protein n=1 Tax=unclassified Bradyrhizobium TaxID=2631580 RepID=UPI001BA4FCC2|nr:MULTISPECIES: hypothetical protein [unclassified Bradyrhizobium]MBR1225974.1 hypothetical protein [Bradyrhizobium sp. AUGA SZCCT0176]MBR1296928.1 hypothetical protein [Bradyrhizobium sp. AUGA SZCCT0042]